MAKPLLRRSISKREQLEQNLEHVNQEMYKRNAELAQINRTLTLLRTIDTLILERHGSTESVYSEISKALVNNSDYSWAALFVKESGHEHLNLLGSFPADINNIQEYAFINSTSEWVKNKSKIHTLSLSKISDKDFSKHLNTGQSFGSNLRNQHIDLVYFIKLLARDKIVGILTIGFPSQIKELNEERRLLLDRLGDAVGVAVDNKILFDENQRIVKKLEVTNKKLKELDDAKDDFISMASHQLRTPLSVIKGYVKMVTDGETGKVTQQQKKFLTQALVSSDSMVRLVTELLNVSRITSGKFNIDPSPVKLADLIENEVKQLTNMAEAHKVELSYSKPANFPILMLDEGKIQQVVANFIDNAIHYSKSKGGKIDVQLTYDKDIVFKVVDNGIGVPDSEKEHLFTKFFRAKNAKDARPDGTGVGIYLAKVVVTEQGGELIFESKEGEGSTFGFRFNSDKIVKKNNKDKQPSKPLEDKKSV